MLSENIFNSKKSDYDKPSLFLGEKNGLVDTVNKHYPKIWSIYKTMKSQDWDELEFDFTSCISDFKRCDPDVYSAMILTLGWQWEADSTVAHAIAPLVAPLVSSDELWSAWLRITDNENVHACTYSEIIRVSFENPREVLATIIENNNSIRRLEGVSGVLADVYDISHKYALGQVPNDQNTYNHVFMFTTALLYLERLQFMASFAVTFSITDTGLFQPIGKAVQRIAQDEIEIHTELDMEVIRTEMQTERGKLAYEQTKERMTKVLNEVVQQECIWTDYLFSEGRELLGLNPPLLKKWVAYNAKVVFDFMGYEVSKETLELLGLEELPTTNPLKFMESIIDISKTQPSPQEEDIGTYRTNVLDSDDDGGVYEL